jgi:pectin methylesterase-like acyl-CoA thioesterase
VFSARGRLRISLVLFCGVFLIDRAPAQVPPPTRYVSSTDATCAGKSPCYSTIQAAVTAAAAGDTVQVQPGLYPELVRITSKSNLILEGDPESVPGSAVIATPDTGFADCMAGTACASRAS